MATIVLASMNIKPQIEKAADTLTKQGHEVIVTERGSVLLSHVLEGNADIIVFSLGLTEMESVDQVFRLLKKPEYKTIGSIFICYLDNETNCPIRSWEEPISTFLPFCPSAWQIILAVEQLLYLTVKAK